MAEEEVPDLQDSTQQTLMVAVVLAVMPEDVVLIV
jgi:hypothetical protein